MEEKLENKTMTEEALDEVTGGIIDDAPTMGMARYSIETQKNLDALNLIGPDPTSGMFNVVPTDQVEDKNVVFY